MGLLCRRRPNTAPGAAAEEEAEEDDEDDEGGEEGGGSWASSSRRALPSAMSAVCAFRFFLRLRKDIGCHDDHCTKVWYPPGTEIFSIQYPGTDAVLIILMCRVPGPSII